MKRENYIRIAEETMEFTENLIQKQEYKKCEKVEVYSPDHLYEMMMKEDFVLSEVTKETKVSIVNADSFEAAKDLDNPLVMNFANAHRPGGGFLSGARAQEESLCRCSTLYKSISSKKAQEMYDYNNRNYDPCDSDYMLLSEYVYVFRDKDGAFLDAPFWTSVVTIPAPNRNGRAASVPQEELDEMMESRLIKMFVLAAKKGYRNLVLGAWGCGAFGNDTERVARYFYKILYSEYDFKSLFETITFAILGDEQKISIFKEVFENQSDRENGIPFNLKLDTLSKDVNNL